MCCWPLSAGHRVVQCLACTTVERTCRAAGEHGASMANSFVVLIAGKHSTLRQSAARTNAAAPAQVAPDGALEQPQRFPTSCHPPPACSPLALYSWPDGSPRNGLSVETSVGGQRKPSSSAGSGGRVSSGGGCNNTRGVHHAGRFRSHVLASTHTAGGRRSSKRLGQAFSLARATAAKQPGGASHRARGGNLKRHHPQRSQRQHPLLHAHVGPLRTV